VRRDSPPSREAWKGATSDAQDGADGGSVAGTVSSKWAKGTGGPAGSEHYNLTVAFDTTQLTHPANRSVPKPGDPCHPLAAGAHPPAVAFDARQNDVLLYGDKTGPLDTDGHSVGVCVTGDRTHALTTRSAAEEDGTGRGTPIVPMAFGFDAGQSENPKATHQFSVECAPPLIKARPMSIAGAQMAVRRLTPRECERLQGFSDDYTRISYKKKSADECPDGPRYKALGNSMAVPVMRWLGERIAKVEKV
jgi:DNA (cytosine-5)-methyltransferase 1